MAVSSTINRILYAGNGATTVFAFADYLILNTDLKVLLTDNATGVPTPWILNTDYTLAFSGSQINGAYPGGASITAIVAPAAGKTLTLYRDPPETQGTHWTDNDPMPAGTLETTVDKAVLLIQRLRDLASRAIGLADGFVATFDPTLPVLLPANYLLGINATGDGLVAVPASGGSGGGSSGATVNPASSTTTLAVGAPVDAQYIPCDATGGAFVVNLPAANLAAVGQIFQIKKVDVSANAITIAVNGSDVILSTVTAASALLNYQGKSYSLVCRAAGFWDVI